MTRTGELQGAPATRVPARTSPAVALVFLGSALALYLLCARFPVLPDGDSYYHLPVARAGRRRPVLLGVLACLHALCYAAFQAFLGLCVLFFLCALWVGRRAEWRLLVYPAIGVALGLLLHPQFAANRRVWLVQNVGFFVRNETVDLGPEI